MVDSFYILDLDDGPSGGGGASLARLLKHANISHACWTPSPLSSGWERGDNVTCFAPEMLEQALSGQGKAAMPVPGTIATLTMLRELRQQEQLCFGDALESLLDCPSGLQALLSSESSGVTAVEHSVFAAPVERSACEFMRRGGWMLTEEGIIHAIEDDGEAWYRMKQAQRREAGRVALVPKLGQALYLGAHYIADELSRCSIFVRVDSMRPHWRPALARTVNGKPWQTVNDQLDEFKFADGFWQTAWLLEPGQSRPKFLTALPLPAAWLSIDSTAWLSALLDRSESQISSADRYYADAPIDRAIDSATMIERTAL